MTAKKNPDWIYEELILAAKLVFENQKKALDKNDPRVVSLASLLRKAGFHPLESRTATFRNADGVARKTQNIADHVPGFAGTPSHGNKLDKVVMDAFLLDPISADREANQIMLAIAEGKSKHYQDSPNFEQIDEAPEGRLLRRLVSVRERDPKLRKSKIDKHLAEGKELSCEVCNFNFEEKYGERGKGYIEVHHVDPLHVTGLTKTSIEGLALLCSNCHRMIHRNPWTTPAELVTY